MLFSRQHCLAMSDKPVSIMEFADLPSASEVVGIGKVMHPRGGAQECEVEVLLAERDRGSFQIGRLPIVKWIGCGQLDLVTVGSRWNNGVRDGFTTNRTMTADVEILGTKTLPNPATHRETFRYHPTEQIAGAPCFRLMLSNVADFADPEIPQAAIVPKIELARALFGVNSRFLLEMFDGIRNRSVSPDRGILDRKRSGIADRKVTLFCSTRLKRREAFVMAALVADDHVRRFHDGVFQSLTVQPAFRGHTAAFANPPLPFASQTRWTLEGRWFMPDGLRLTSDKVFLVTRISSLSFPVAFDAIEMHYGPTTTSYGSEGMPPPTGRRAVRPAGPVRFRTGRAPGAGQGTSEVTITGTTLLGEADVELVAIAMSVTVQPKSGTFVQDVDEEKQASSTAGRDPSGDSDVGAVIIRRGRRRSTDQELASGARRLSDALSKTADALLLVLQRKPWRLRVILEAAAAVISAKGERLRDRLFDEILQVEVETDDGFVTIVDAGSLPGDSRSLGFIRDRAGSNLTLEEQRSIREYAIKHDGHWLRRRQRKDGTSFEREPLLDLEVRPAARPAKVFDSEEEYATFLEARIDRVSKGDRG